MACCLAWVLHEEDKINRDGGWWEVKGKRKKGGGEGEVHIMLYKFTH